ncbi:SRPBCC family protein, partial [Ascidiaceihabitans sp.]|nr:SRPBCC family protein [Ascidiaceihabitans sp.]
MQRSVHCTQHLTAEADVVWAHLRDFCAPWHPLIATMKAEVGGRVRAFTVMGEDTLYRERLAWFSDTGRSMSYMHLEGIEGAHRYEGRLSVTPADKGGCVVSMSAEIEATAARAEEIASGTEFVFETGLKALT